MKKINRRGFIKGAGLVSVAGLGGLQLGFAGPSLKGGNNNQRNLLVYVFLNGGMDGLNMVPPRNGSNYNEYANVLRPNLHISNSISLALNGQNAFGLHPNATGLAGLFNQNKMAIIHATGLLTPNRSHFEATRFLEFGVQQAADLNSGWIKRYFDTSLNPATANAQIPTLVPSYGNTDAVLGDTTALVMADPSDFSLSSGHWTWGGHMQDLLASLNADPEFIEDLVANQTLTASSIIQGIDWENYQPPSNVEYPTGFFGDQLKTVAQMYKNDVGLEVAYVPTGGWDTHVDQGTGDTGVFADLVAELSQGLTALYQDLSASHGDQFTIVVQSEFGRRAYENGAQSTDHGYGNPMFVIGDAVNGGFYGEFPGLAPNELLEAADVDVTVDYRDVVSEVLMRRQGNRFLGYMFPGYDEYMPLGIVSGNDLTPVFEQNYDPIFAAGFD